MFKLTPEEKQAIKKAGKGKPFKSFQKEAIIYFILLALASIFLWEHPNILILFVIAMATIIGARYSQALKSSKATYSVGEKVEKEIKRPQELTKKVALPIIFAIVGVFVLIMAGLIIYVLYLKPLTIKPRPTSPQATQEEKLAESVGEEMVDISIKSRSSGYIWYKNDKVKIFLYASNETKSIVTDKNKSCEMPTLGTTVFEGDYKLILDPSTSTVDSYGETSGIVWKPASFELEKLKFVEGTLWDGRLVIDSMGWYDKSSQTNLITNLIIVYQYGSCNTIQIKMYGYVIRHPQEETNFVQYRFEHKDGSIKDVLEASLSDIGRPLDIRIGHTDTPYVPGFTSWRYDNSLGKMVYASWNFDSERNLFVED